MQIRELVLYGRNGKVRHLPFSLGTVNIITGKSKSGKSAVGDIIDYCMGGLSCNIADGVVRDTVDWYGLLLQFEDERVFVARKNPEKGQQTTSDCYIEVGKEIESPQTGEFSSNTNVDGIEETLTRRVGISENLNIPPEGQSRKSLAANIRHALYYCFQGQDEIAAKNFLFHRQSENFITQAIKDTIPYFLGAVSEGALALENERSILKRKLVIEKRKLEENRYLMGGGSTRAAVLITEAQQVGLLDANIPIDYQNYGKLQSVLESVEMIKKSITALDKSIESVTREQPKLRTFISKLENDEQQKQEEIKRLKTEIDSLYQQEDEKEKLRDLNVRRGKVIGRISLWLESVQNDATSEAQEQHIKKIEERLNEIDGALNRDSVEERKQSALSRIQQYMTKWAEELQLEHSDSPYRLDLNKMTVVVDKSDRPVPLKQLGSGSNWVGVHLITYFALQYYFIESNRPVPRFLFLDQPSQVYFPSELDEQKIDEDEVNKMYKFIIDRTEELHGQLQVIVVDHTAGEEDQSHQFVTESWWKDDKKLIPDDWYEPNEALIPVS